MAGASGGRATPRRSASSAASPQSPPEQVTTATPRRRRPGPAWRAPWPAPAARGRPGPTPRRPPRTSARKTRWSPAMEPVWAAAAVAPTSDAPTLSTATRTPASAQRASASQRRPPSPSPSRKRATDRTSASSARAVRKCVASSTAWLPQETTVCRRRPRSVPSVLTATLPLWATSATCPAGCVAQRVPPERDPVVQAHDAVAVGADHGERVARGGRLELGLQVTAGAAGVVGEPGRVDDRAAAPRGAGLFDDRRDGRGCGGHDDRIGGRRQVGQRREARPAAHLLVARVHAPHLAGVPEGLEVEQRLVRVGVGARRGTHDGDRARGRAGGRDPWAGSWRSGAGPGGGVYWSIDSTPRRSRPRAMIRRWISLVPSQIRSTRSSRRNRSATLVRM